MTTTIETVPLTLDCILDHAADIVASKKYAGLPVQRQAQFALGDAFGNSGYSGNELYDVKLAVSDLLWEAADQRNLSTYADGTRDVRKVVRLFRRTARKVRG